MELFNPPCDSLNRGLTLLKSYKTNMLIDYLINDLYKCTIQCTAFQPLNSEEHKTWTFKKNQKKKKNVF